MSESPVPFKPLPSKWPLPPMEGARCDMTIGIDYSGGSPRLDRCPNTATETVWAKGPIPQAWVCADCAEKLVAIGNAIRDPRKFPANEMGRP